MRRGMPWVRSLQRRYSSSIIIAGPTGVGKTATSMELARLIASEGNGRELEIISADSAQIYRGLDVGTAKVTRAERGEVRHHLVDEISPFTATRKFSAGTFALRASEIAGEIKARGNVPCVVGGAVFYIDMLLNGTPGTPPSDPGIQARIINSFKGMNWEDSLKRFAEFDPKYAASLGQNDWKRLVRGLEVYEITGKPVSSFKFSPRRAEKSADHLLFFLGAERESLCRRIDRRCEEMVLDGLLEETLGLLRKQFSGYSKVGYLDVLNVARLNPVFGNIGYAEATQYLAKEWFGNNRGAGIREYRTFRRFLEGFMGSSRRFSRKQMSWGRRSRALWIDTTGETVSSNARKIYSSLRGDDGNFKPHVPDENGNDRMARYKPDFSIFVTENCPAVERKLQEVEDVQKSMFPEFY